MKPRPPLPAPFELCMKPRPPAPRPVGHRMKPRPPLPAPLELCMKPRPPAPRPVGRRMKPRPPAPQEKRQYVAIHTKQGRSRFHHPLRHRRHGRPRFHHPLRHHRHGRPRFHHPLRHHRHGRSRLHHPLHHHRHGPPHYHQPALPPAGQHAPAFQCDQRHRQQLTGYTMVLPLKGASLPLRRTPASTRPCPHRPRSPVDACDARASSSSRRSRPQWQRVIHRTASGACVIRQRPRTVKTRP